MKGILVWNVLMSSEGDLEALFEVCLMTYLLFYVIFGLNFWKNLESDFLDNTSPILDIQESKLWNFL